MFFVQYFVIDIKILYYFIVHLNLSNTVIIEKHKEQWKIPTKKFLTLQKKNTHFTNKTKFEATHSTRSANNPLKQQQHQRQESGLEIKTIRARRFNFANAITNSAARLQRQVETH